MWHLSLYLAYFLFSQIISYFFLPFSWCGEGAKIVFEGLRLLFSC